MLKTLLSGLLAILSSLMGGLVFSKMWGWFLVRLFPSAPRLGVMDAVGLLMVLGFPLASLMMMLVFLDAKEGIKKKHPNLSSEYLATAWSLVTTFFIYPLVLLFAWIWHRAIG